MRNWQDLSEDEQLALRLEYQDHLDQAPRSCDLQEKISRFSAWLAERQVLFAKDDLTRRR